MLCRHAPQLQRSGFKNQSTMSIHDAQHFQAGILHLEQTTSPNNLPEKCQECAKSSKPFIHVNCDFCQDLGYHEEIFCDLNRCLQDSSSFVCHAYRPNLKLVGASRSKDLTLPKSLPDESLQNTFQKLLDLDKVKYLRALALQKITHESDRVSMEIKYHFAWNVICRRSVFERPGIMFDPIRNIFSNCGEQIGSIVSLLWLAPDHLHLYVESDGEKSADEIATEMKSFSTVPILAELAKLSVSLNGGKNLWDKAYFVETVG
ncbi:transposase [Thermodesulfobacteriota bacterium]